jgi:uncharacterized membrane protein YdjX (TVP38/TMEM64 family)
MHLAHRDGHDETGTGENRRRAGAGASCGQRTGDDGQALNMQGPAKPQLARAVLRRYGPPLLVVAALLCILVQGWHHHLTLESVVTQRDRFQHFLAGHATVSVLAYVAFYTLLVALSLPCGVVLSTAGGLLFGWLGGALAAITGATLGATVVFLIARTAVGDALSRRAGPWLAKLSEGFQKDALSYMLFLRLVPAFPFWFVNIAPAVLGVPLRTFVLGTVIGITPATFAFAFAGAGLDSVILAAKNEHAACVARKGAEACPLKLHVSSLLTKELILALVLIGLVALMPVMLRKWKQRRRSHAAAK